MDALRLESVWYRYPDEDHDDRWALRDIHFHAGVGEMVVVMGPSGAGKSTLAKCLNRTVPVFTGGTLLGSIRIAGRSAEQQTIGDLAGIVGLVSEDFESQLFATHAAQEIIFGMEQIGVPPAAMQLRLEESLRLVGLSGFDRRDPTSLSGGEKQRLAIAAMLALQPQVLVFDEPTTDLDPVGKHEVLTVLSDMRRRGFTLVVIEHEIAAAELADRLVILAEGAVVAEGRADVLLRQPELLEAHAIRPPDAARLGARLALQPVPRSTPEILEQLRSDDRWTKAAGDATTEPAGNPTHLSFSRPAEPVVQLQKVDFEYEPGPQVLHEIDLEISAADFIALIGQNGSGKTTLAKHLNGLLSPSRGEARIHNRHEGKLRPLAATVGYVFQNPDSQIFAARVWDEVAFGPRNLQLGEAEVEERVAWALGAVQLEDAAEADPFILAKGHRKRLAVASILALRPQILVLDEPTTGLDYREQREMMEMLTRLNQNGIGIVIITHSPWIAGEYAKRGVLMSRGRILFDGPLATLLGREELLKAARFALPEIRRIARELGLDGVTVEQVADRIAARLTHD